MENSVAQRLVTALKDSGISFVSYLPETRLSRMIPLLQKDSWFRVVPTTSESEAVSIAAGAALSGNQAAVYMEGTGVYVSAYSLFAVGERFGVPMLLLVSYVGSFNDKKTAPPFPITLKRRSCSRPSVSSTRLSAARKSWKNRLVTPFGS